MTISSEPALLSEPVALFDLDGTLANLDKAKDYYMKLIRAPEEGEYVSTGNDDNMPEYMVNRWRLIKSLPGFWRSLERLEIGFEILNAALELKFKPNALSKAPRFPRAAAMEKAEWCDVQVPDVLICLSDDKGLVYGKMLVNDFSPYIERWLTWRKRGLVIMPAHPYNANFKHPNVVRYDGSNYKEMYERMKIVRATVGDLKSCLI